MKYAIKVPVDDGWLYVTETKEDGRRDIKTYNTYAEAQRDNTWVWNNKGEVVEYKEPKPPKPELPHASNKEIADEKIGKWLSAALEDPTTCGAMKDDINEWFKAAEEERLRSKKKSIHDELYDVVKMEMFKASSKLEGIDYDKISRVEVIDETGRGYIKYLKKEENVRYELQDDNRTLKIFIDTLTATHELDRIDYLKEENKEVPCKTHPDAPHGFDRNASLSQNRYVCECEYWEPDWEPEELEVEGWNIEKPAELKQLLEEMIERMNRIEYGDD